MSEIKLKPCPFCGGKPYIETNHRAFINAKTTKVAFVRCKGCNARTERIPLEKYGKTSHSLEAELDAIEAWNKRTEKTGRWMISTDGYYPYCSICKNEPQGGIMISYCPNCGAFMKG